MHPKIAELSDDLVAALFDESPLNALLLGIDDAPGGLGDLSERAQNESMATYAAIARRAEDLSNEIVSEFDQRDIATIDHVRRTAGNYVERLRFPLAQFTVTNFPAAPFSSLLSTLPQLPINGPTREARYLECLRQLPQYLEQASQRLRSGSERGQTPTTRGVRNAINQLDAILSDNDRGGLRRQGEALSAEFVSQQDKLINTVVTTAIAAYRTVLVDEILANGRDDEHCGLSWIAGGDEIYRSRVKGYTWSDDTPDEVHALGLAIMTKLHAEFEEIGSRIWETSTFGEVRERLLNDPALHFDSSQEILETARAAVRHAESVAPQFFGIVPSEPCEVSPIPDALADGAAVAYYYGGSLDGSRKGTYFVNTTKPTLRNRHTAESVAYHEAVPGHHFQLTIAQELANSHLLYRVTRDVTTSEGWGLYTERLADEMGLYSDDLARLGMLTADAMRAARLVVDSGLHALGWSRQRAIDWMEANVPMAPIEIAQEIDRYIVMPAQALAYMYGKLEIESCRRRAKEKLADAFNLQSFHDMILVTGPLALPALRASVDRWIDSSLRAQS